MAPGGTKGAAAVVQESIAFERADVEAALVRLAVEFGDVALVGPRAFARFTAPSDVRLEAPKESRDASRLRDLAIEFRLPPLLTGLCWTPANTSGALDQTLAERL